MIFISESTMPSAGMKNPTQIVLNWQLARIPPLYCSLGINLQLVILNTIPCSGKILRNFPSSQPKRFLTSLCTFSTLNLWARAPFGDILFQHEFLFLGASSTPTSFFDVETHCLKKIVQLANGRAGIINQDSSFSVQVCIPSQLLFTCGSFLSNLITFHLSLLLPTSSLSLPWAKIYNRNKYS